MKMGFILSSLVAAVMALAAAAAPVRVDSALPTYSRVSGVSGTIKSIGSDTMNNLLTLWAEEFNRLYPNVRVEIEGKGSSTAPPALIEGQAQFGPMSRPMRSSEEDEFERKFGYKPTLIRAGIDALVVYVHKDSPLEEISLDQVRRVFSVDGPNITWGDLGVRDPEYASRPIILYGRNSASGTYGFFKDHALGKKDFKPNVREMPGSSGVVQAVATDRYAMGYSGLGYKTADVKALRISVRDREEAFAANMENAYSGEYPLARFLYIYINKAPNEPLDPLRAEFVRMMFSQQGQEAVVKDGYIPVPAEIAREELRKAGLGVNF